MAKQPGTKTNLSEPRYRELRDACTKLRAMSYLLEL